MTEVSGAVAMGKIICTVNFCTEEINMYQKPASNREDTKK